MMPKKQYTPNNHSGSIMITGVTTVTSYITNGATGSVTSNFGVNNETQNAAVQRPEQYRKGIVYNHNIQNLTKSKL